MDDPDFEQFWTTFPRKEGKKDAMKAWHSMNEGQKFAAREAVAVHVKFWDLSGREKHYMPMPATWLRGERWADELEMPKPKEVTDAWWTSNEGISRKAKESGIFARSGESYQDLKARILAKTRVA